MYRCEITQIYVIEHRLKCETFLDLCTKHGKLPSPCPTLVGWIEKCFQVVCLCATWYQISKKIFTIDSTNIFNMRCISMVKVARAWRETTPVCSGLTKLVRAGYSRHDSGASRERARIMRRAHAASLPSSTYPARSTLRGLICVKFLCFQTRHQFPSTPQRTQIPECSAARTNPPPRATRPRPPRQNQPIGAPRPRRHQQRSQSQTAIYPQTPPPSRSKSRSKCWCKKTNGERYTASVGARTRWECSISTKLITSQAMLTVRGIIVCLFYSAYQ